MFTRFIALPALLLAISIAGAPESAAQADDEPTVAATDTTVETTTDTTMDTTTVEPPIIIDSDTNQYDLRSGVTRFSDNVMIQRGAMLVNADEGVVHQAEGRITRVELFGSPTTWRDQLDDGSIVEGRADQIEFEVIKNVVTLTGNARLRHEQGEFTGNQLIYDLDTESLSGRGTDGNQARVVLEGDSMRNAASGDDGSDDGNGNGNETRPAEPETGGEDGQNTDESAPVDPPAAT